jgi:Domain of unknown function (DUF3520)/von Willebrand factor
MINLDDPKLTAYALGELSSIERTAMEKAMAGSPEAQAYVEEIRELAGSLRAEFADEAAATARRPFNILPLPSPRSFWSDARWMSLALAAMLAIAAVVAAVALSARFAQHHPAAAAHPRKEVDDGVQMEVQSEAPAVDGNGFVSAAEKPRSSFSPMQGTGSYDKVRRAIDGGSLPPRDVVQIDELVNSFTYDYPSPQSGQLHGISLEIAGCPWTRSHRLVRIGVKGPIDTSLLVQVNFNPARVRFYRLIGSESGANNGRVAGVEGDTLTALYEIVPVDSGATAAITDSPPESVLVEVRQNRGGSETTEIETRKLVDTGARYEEASPDFKFAAAVAEFGMLLRNSPGKGEATFASVLAQAQESKGSDEAGDRAGFVDLVRRAQSLPL